MKAFSKPAIFLSSVFFILGVIAIYSNPTSVLVITLGMFLIGVAMINLAFSIPTPMPRKARAVRRESLAEIKPEAKVRKRRKKRKR